MADTNRGSPVCMLTMLTPSVYKKLDLKLGLHCEDFCIALDIIHLKSSFLLEKHNDVNNSILMYFDHILFSLSLSKLR